MADASKAALKVSLTVEEKKGGPAKSSLAPPIQNEKIRSGSITKEGVRKGSGDGARASDNSSSHSDSDRPKATGDADLFALATSTSKQMSNSTSTDSFRELLQPRRRSTELLNKARIGNYDYERAVQGLMGKYTYFGYRIDTNAKVTIKIIEKKNPALEALRIEYTLLRNISHPHVLQVYDILEDDQNVYFVMEYASRGRLIYEIGGSGPMQEREIKALMQQIVSAVVHNYELRHAVFREMELDYFTYFRPENVFLDQDGNIKIGAYGSIDLRKPSRTWFKQHTYPSFAAPEILRGKTSLLGLDSWSVGVLLFVLAKANFPFSGETVDDVLKSMATPPKLDLGSEEMRNLCNVLLQANTFSRLPLMEVMRHPWWSSTAVAAPELVRQNSRKEGDDKGKKGKSLFGISFGKDSKDKK